MADYGLTDLRFYMQWPMCGHCSIAWDLIYQRLRSPASPAHYLRLCTVGGCDPEIWDFLDDRTGWPVGFKLKGNGMPDWSRLPDPPMAENETFHRRDRDDDKAPWRNVWERLRKENLKREARRKNIADEDLDFGDDEEDEDEEDDTESTYVADEDLEWD